MGRRAGDGKGRLGGRATGKKNEDKQRVADIVSATGKCPVRVLTDLLDHEEAHIRLSAAKELTSYMFPKKKAIEHSGEIKTNEQSVRLTPELLSTLIKSARGEPREG